MNLSMPLVYARLALIAVLLSYTFVPSLRVSVTQALLGTGGILLLSVGLISVGSPTVLGYSSSYTSIGDSITLIEGGILAFVLSVELSARRTKFMARSFAYIHSLFVTQPKKLSYSPPLLPVRILKKKFQFKPVLSGDRLVPTLERKQGSLII